LVTQIWFGRHKKSRFHAKVEDVYGCLLTAAFNMVMFLTIGFCFAVETQKNVTEYKLKLQRAEHEITTLQGTVSMICSLYCL
jgi:hypothetical protein